MLNNDYKEMLQCLNAERVDYLLIGAYAMAAHGFPPGNHGYRYLGKTIHSQRFGFLESTCAKKKRYYYRSFGPEF